MMNQSYSKTVTEVSLTCKMLIPDHYEHIGLMFKRNVFVVREGLLEGEKLYAEPKIPGESGELGFACFCNIIGRGTPPSCADGLWPSFGQGSRARSGVDCGMIIVGGGGGDFFSVGIDGIS
jgi:hypothetical protein